MKDDSGSYAVFTEQGLWASQTTAAKVMDVIARLPDWMLPDCSEFQSQNVQKYGYVFHDTSGQTHVPTLKIQWFLLNESCTEINLQDCGKDSSEKFY